MQDKKETEKKLIEELLKNKEIFPLNIDDIIYEERPDCRIKTNNIITGIEITIAMDEFLKKVKEERNKMDSSISFCPTMFEKRKMISKEIKEKLNNCKEILVGTPYKGDELEQNIFNEIKESIEKKIKKFEKYEKFDKNWLYIYHDNKAGLREDTLIELVKEYLNNIDFKFDNIILKIGENIYRFDKNLDL